MKNPTLLLAALALAPALAGAQDLRPGQYKTVTKMDMAGRAMPPMQGSDCVTRRDIDEGLARMGHDKETSCKASDIKRGAGTVSYKVACAEDGVKSTGDVVMKMAGDSFDYDMTLRNPQIGAVKVNVRGTRTGDCRK